MKGTYLGEFQEIVLLAIMVLDKNAYGVTIQEEIKNKLNRDVSRGALHAAFSRLEHKGYIQFTLGGATAVRGGRRKKYYTLTNTGKQAVIDTRNIREEMWNAIPNLTTLIRI